MTGIPPRLHVKDMHGPRTVSIDKDPFTIGRSSASDLQLTGTDVSRDHLHIVRVGATFVARDRQSKYGTFINGVPVTEHTLSHGDRVRVGRSSGVELVFLAPGEPAIASSGTAMSGDLAQIAGVLEVLRAIGSEGVLDEVLALVVDKAIDLAGVERGAILLADPSGALAIAAAREEGRRPLPVTGLSIGRKIPERVLATGVEELVTSIPELPDAVAHEHTIAQHIVTVMCTPLRLVRLVDRAGTAPTATTIGVLYLDSHHRGRTPSTAARTGLQALAREAAVAIESARLYKEAAEKARVDQELRTAAAIQQALLPPPWKEAGFFEADGVSLPCNAVGGDFFDYMELPDGRIGIALADVAGKGPGAALLTAVLQGIFSAASTIDADVAGMARRANRALIGRRLDSRFATAVFASLGRDGTLTYCNAGHNPPFLVRAGGITRLTIGGLIVGLFADTAYESESMRLDPGDTVLLFSDGVSEAAGADGEEFGDDRIRAVCEANRGAAATDLVHALLAAVGEFTRGVPQRDDMTAVAVRYAPE